jgi:hypothetical protein
VDLTRQPQAGFTAVPVNRPGFLITLCDFGMTVERRDIFTSASDIAGRPISRPPN